MLAEELTEETLIVQAKAGVASAWEAIYDSYYPKLYRYAYAKLRSREEAEDIAAQVFVVALRSIDKFEYRGKPLLAWLYRIAQNLIIEKARRQRRFDNALPLLEVQTTTEDYFDSFVLRDAISRLTRDQQEVVVLRFLVALSAKEVALVIGKNEAAVFSLQARAINSLRRMLGPSHEPALTKSAAS